MAGNKQKPIKKVKQPSSEEEEEDEDIELDSDQLAQLEDSDDLVGHVEDSDEDEQDQEELEGDYDEDESLNSDEIPNLSITEDEDDNKASKKGKLKVNLNEDSNSVLGDLNDDDNDDDEEEESGDDSNLQDQDLDNIEAEYSEEDEEDEKDKELFQQNVNSSNYFEKILKISKQNLSQIENVELIQDILKKKNISKIDLEKEEIYQNDQGEFKKLIDEMSKNSKDEESKLYPITKLTRSKNLNLEQGISLLNSKNEIFSNYLICLHFYMLYKLNGISLKDSPVVKKLIYYKTLLSKLKPVEQKMEYQISKLMKFSLKTSEQGKGTKTSTSISQDPISFKPRPELIDDSQGEEDDQEQEDISENVSNLSDEEETKAKKQVIKKKPVAKYVAPKTMAVQQDKAERRLEVEKKRREAYLMRQLKANINADINEIKNDRPVVERFAETDKIAKRESEIQKYELNNFVRLQRSKQDKKRIKEFEKNKAKLDRIDDMSEQKYIRELLHHQKLAVDPEFEKKEKQNLQQTLQKYNKNKNEKQGGNKFNNGGNKFNNSGNKFNKGPKPTKKFKKN
ncbi:Sas10/Utp3/C1D family protein (macronuclear) [Tetrahymena thermophila SB210]|uniref:Sas10/Utp3/C1D family protein n=1 Tax=Tetrahymena thermophila (strain SB210) TaxID=312017 RepID=A4VEL5_TETTS|nr:Sas10/Utp3/C1D family protein [Tetrahymena thermophila SB210]EDK31964.1 Sas10/Utp3/C1D family protein [Tetrahymena thermophila SB210]|eukprot:XP_001470729.1 Sas10/Utp3/C1D family protein [Tetrahymena thermophila SB210]